MSSIFGIPPAGGNGGGDGAALPDDAQITETDRDETEEGLAARLKPDSELHRKLMEVFKRYLELSYRNISKRFPEWDRVDEHLRMYVNLDSPARRGNKMVDPKLKENPQQRAVTVPVSYAIFKVIVTELFSMFASRIPFLRMSGRGPEDEATAPNIEALLDYDHMQSGGTLTVYSMIADIVRYGQGTLYDHWEEVTKIQDVTEQNPISKLAIAMGILPPEARYGPVTVKEFNKSASVDPYTWWRDPRVSIANLQEGDFSGHRAYKSWNYLKDRSMADKRGPYFNLDHLKQQSTTRSGTRETQIVARSRFSDEDLALSPNLGDAKDRGYFTIDHMQMRLVPKDHDLGQSTTPQIYWLSVADEKTIVRCHPGPFDHDMFSYSAGELDPDPHCMFSPGLIENMDGPQRLVNWFFNSHVENVRKTMNNEVIWSPRFFEASSFLNPGPARWIEMTTELVDLLISGRQIGEFYQQLHVADITTGHLKIVEFLMEMINRLSGSTDPMAGVPTQEQKTLGEINLLTAGASKRNAVVGQMIDLMAIQPWAYRQISNRQQYTSIEQYVRILGNAAQEFDPATGQPTLRMISKDDIAGNYDYVPHSALGPGDPRRAAEVWMGILQSYGAYPILAQPDEHGRIPDVSRMFKEAVRNMGVRDLDSFYKLPPPPIIPPGTLPIIVPDAVAMQMVQSGNAQPLELPGMAMGAPPA